MVTKCVSRRFLRRVGFAALAIALLAGVTVAHASDDEQEIWCPSGYAYSEDAGKCVYVTLIDCGPNPYTYNNIGGHWEREFNKWCFNFTDDPFESFFHQMNWAEAQARLAALGLSGLARDRQVAALFAAGYWNPVDEVTEPLECPEGMDWDPLGQRCDVITPPDCGPNPYTYNNVGRHWERRFHNLCFESRDDPFEILFHQMDYGEVQAFLANLGLNSLTHRQQVDALSALGYRDAEGAFVPVKLRPLPTGQASVPATTAARTHVVQRGDWLHKIAREHGVSVSDLIRLNSATYPTLLTNPNMLYVGWVLKLP